MTRVLPLAALLAAGFSYTTLAAEAPSSTDLAAIAIQSAELTVAANAQQVQQILLAQGYTNVSNLDRNESGHWTGTAVKNGNIVGVTVVMPRRDGDVSPAY